MTKQQLIDKIKDFDIDQFNLDDYKNVRIGEYALPAHITYDDFGYENFIEQFNELKLKHYKNIDIDHPCSKSGDIISIRGTIDDTENEFYYIAEDIINNTSWKTAEQLKQDLKDLIGLEIKFQKTKNALDREIKKITKWIETIAIGKRFSVFSNGEVVFQPIKGNQANYTLPFTPYFNPNEA